MNFIFKSLFLEFLNTFIKVSTPPKKEFISILFSSFDLFLVLLLNNIYDMSEAYFNSFSEKSLISNIN